MTINPDVMHAVVSTLQAKKPIGALCIAPVILGKLVPNVKLTFGKDPKINSVFQALGVKTVNASAKDIVIDPKNKVVTTPCYMLDARISELAQGIEKLVQALLKMV